MRRLSIIVMALIMALAAIASPIAAQDDEAQVVRPLSQRYELTVPADWVFDANAALFDDAELPQSETVMVADSPDTVTIISKGDFDPLSDEADGVFFITALLPASVLDELGDIGTETFAQQLASEAESGSNGTTEVYNLELRGVSGTAVDIVLDERLAVYVFLEDSSQNWLAFIGGTPLDQRAVLDEALASLTYFSFTDDELTDPNNLTATMPIIEGFVAVDVPPGWWAFIEDQDDGQRRYVLVPQQSTVLNFDDPIDDIVETGDLGLVTTRIDRDDIPDEAYNEDGTLNLEAVLRDEFSDEENSRLTVEEWDGNPGLQGVQFSAHITETNTAVQGLLLEGDEALYVIAGLVSVDRWPEVEALIGAILDTARRIEEERVVE